jgi:Ca2+/H+ antiporter, TMEM165/GDT1 family
MRQRFNERKIGGFIVMAIAGTFVFSGGVMLLWNALMPELFHLAVINIWQALGLLVLSKILFGSFRGGGRWHWKRDNLRQAWGNMNPEERAAFKQKWEQRCGRPFRGETNTEEPA